METTSITPLHERLRIAAGSRTYRQLGDLTNTNHETVRRYMLGQAPSAEFLAAACSALEINAQWLLVGAGPMKSADIRHHALGEAKVSELLSAMSTTLERLMDRVERLESYMQVLETHLRASEGDSGIHVQTLAPGANSWAMNPPIRGIEAPAQGTSHVQAGTQQSTRAKVASVLDAVPKRPRSSAG